jgi:hypothetical protein
MSEKLASFRRRLAKLEQECADRVRREELVDCNCPEIKSVVSFLAFGSKQFEAEMNKTCPVHGFRRLGSIVALNFVEPNGTETEDSAKLSQLIDTYQIRLAQHSQSSVSLKKKMTHKNLDSRCKALAKSGKPCRAAATAGGLCFFHANPDKAAALGRIGGRANRHAAGENADPLPTMDNSLAVRDTVARLIAGVAAGPP